MKRNSLVVVAALLIVLTWAVAASAQSGAKQAFATFVEGGVHTGACDSTNQFVPIYVYGANINEFYTSVEWQLVLPPCLFPVGRTYGPKTTVVNEEPGPVGPGPWYGVQQAFWPPINGYFPGLDLWCTVFTICTGTCDMCGYDLPVMIGPNPVSGLLQGTRNDVSATTFGIVGLTNLLCPLAVGTEETTWGKVKALYGDQ